MTTLLQLLGVSDIRDVSNVVGVPVNDIDFSGDWTGFNASVLPAAIPGPIDGGSLAGELLDGGVGVVQHYIERQMQVYAGRTYHFSLTLNIARHRCEDNASKRGVGFFVVGAPFAPAGDDEAPGNGILLATQLDEDVDSEEAPPMWANASLGTIPELQQISGRWGRGVFSARAASTGLVGVRIYINGQNTGNFALAYDASLDPIETGFGITECRVVDITGSPFVT